MKNGLVVLLFCLPALLYGQYQPSDFGSVTPADFEADKLFPEASSVVLFDYMWKFYGDGNPVVERHIRVKINSREAFRKWGDYVLGNKYAKFKKIRAATYFLENGNVVTQALSGENIIKVRQSSNERVLSLPNLREGCIIELSYTANFAYEITPDWMFQYDVPVLWNEYVLGGVRPLIHVIIGGHMPSLYDQNFRGRQTRWVFTNVPAYTYEPHMISPNDVHGRLEFYTTDNDWVAIADHFRFGVEYSLKDVKPGVIQELTKLAAGDAVEPLEKARRITAYMKQNFRSTEDGLLESKDVVEALETKKGSASQIMRIYYALLKQAGLNPNPVLVSTRSNGDIAKAAPSRWQFNYYLIKISIGEDEYFLDCSDPLLPFGALPPDCINAEGLEVLEKGANWRIISPSRMNKVSATARLTVTPDMMLRGRASILSHGYQARELRRSVSEHGKDDFVKARANVSAWEIDSLKLLNVDAVDLPLQETYFGRIPGKVHGTSERIYLDPYILLIPQENDWKAESRKYAIDLDLPGEKLLIATISLPEGFQIEELAKDEIIHTPDSSMICTFKTLYNQNTLVVTYHEIITRTRYKADEYGSIRNFYNQILARQSRPIVLVKKTM
jgi:hypothetical protein